MVDIHTHILPGLDDGAENMQEALEMAALAVSDGIVHMAATSHGNYYPYSLDEYFNKLNRLQAALAYNQIPLKLYPGMEIFLDEDAIALIEKQKLLSLNGTRYLLVEFPFDEDPQVVLERLEELREADYEIVLAHPERYVFIQKDPELAYYLAQQGCVLQVNTGSLTGDFGQVCQRLSHQMLEDGIVSVLATDAHDANHRPPLVRRTAEALRGKYPDSRLHLWFSENPSRILKGYSILR